MSVTVEFLRANPPHRPGERAALPRARAAALIAAGAARLPTDLPPEAGPLPDLLPAGAPAPDAPAGGMPAGKTTALRRGTRKRA